MLAKRGRRPLAMLLAVVMLLGMLPISALAAYNGPDQVVNQGGKLYYAAGDTTEATGSEDDYVVALGKRNLLWDLLPDHIEEHVLEVDHAE